MSLPKKPAHIKRLKEWERWLLNFKSQDVNSKKVKFTYIPNAAWLLNDMYWRLAEQYLRPVLKTTKEHEEEHRIHPYKIISASEITIMMVEPISVIDNPIIEKQFNASFAWFVATQILEGWETGNKIKILPEHIELVAMHKENIDALNMYPESFAAEHLKWLTMLNVTIEKPLLLNAQCWRLFYLNCLSVAGKGKLK